MRALNGKLLIVILVLGALALSAGGASASASPWNQPNGPAPGAHQVRRIAIISAYAPELTALKALATIEKTAVINGRTVYVGTLAGQKVLMTLSGVSMVNAAMAAQVLIDHFPVERIIFSGIAGGVNPGLSIGDVVVPAQWTEYQENVFARETAPGVYTPPSWFTPFLPNYGMMYPQKVGVTTVKGTPDQETQVEWFAADPAMVAVARKATGKITLDRCTPANVCLDQTPIVKVGGNGVSGPTFVDNTSYRQYAWSTWQADALDMESAAVAHVATVNGVPFLVFRSLSDLAGGGTGENEMDTFFQLAANNSAKVLVAFLEAWPARRTTRFL
jgi:adenosylhomocysteine nucleosidase